MREFYNRKSATLELTIGRVWQKNKYIKGTDNDAAYALIRPPIINFDVKEGSITRKILFNSYCVNKLDGRTSPLTYLKIDKYQRKDKGMVDKLEHVNYHTECFYGDGITTQLIYLGNYFFMPTILKKM